MSSLHHVDRALDLHHRGAARSAWRPVVTSFHALSWLEHYRRFWEQSLERLAAYLRQLEEAGRTDGTKR